MRLAEFSKEQIIDRLRFENPWWNKGEIDGYYKQMTHRAYFKLFIPLVRQTQIKRAVVLMGPRRVGKTVLIYQAIQDLINDGVNPEKICYLSVETPIYNNIGLEQLFQYYKEAIGDNTDEGHYLFFDEIQYLPKWEVHLKSLVDSFKSIKFVVSGSAAAALKLKSIESGAGRFTDFLLPPLTFHEYIELKGLQDLVQPESGGVTNYAATDIDRLNEHFVNYMNYGGYPEVIFSDTIQSDPGRYIRNDIIDKVLLRDLPSLYGIQNVQELNSLFTTIAYNSGNEISLDGLASKSGVSKNTITRYINYLEAAFLVTKVHRIDYSAKRFKRATYFKLYLTNPSLRSALFSPISDADPHMGNMVETAIYSQWNHSSRNDLYYARWAKGEIDIVSLNHQRQKPNWIVEIKWTNRFAERPNELTQLISFAKKHGIQSPIVTTLNYSGRFVSNVCKIEYLPASVYCYALGRNIIDNKVRDL